ncbi:CoA transferase subunit A [Fodinicola acaciae]|uniref:CoA transferase subunit A n=1 Tax=Fodinicola acaciae TaxID=2681555 RepID=UPI0013D37B57|nr:CoA transferase subunit A [Fodinicola acaciae]
MTGKLVTMAEAAALVADGSSVACGLALEAAIPFAFTHELIRQRKRGLRMIGPIADAVFDQLVGAGCVAEIEAAWIGNVTTGAGYCFQRAVRAKEISVRQHSNHTLSLALQAAVSGVPYLPTRTALGTDIAVNHDGFTTVRCPFTDQVLLAVRAVRPDVAVVHVQRADARGNAHAWGNLGITVEAVHAARTVIVIASDIVPSEVIRERPELTLVPGAFVDAVVHCPGGTHPAPLLGYAEHSPETYRSYGKASATVEGFQEWLREWVLDVPDRAAYLEKL